MKDMKHTEFDEALKKHLNVFDSPDPKVKNHLKNRIDHLELMEKEAQGDKDVTRRDIKKVRSNRILLGILTFYSLAFFILSLMLMKEVLGEGLPLTLFVVQGSIAIGCIIYLVKTVLFNNKEGVSNGEL